MKIIMYHYVRPLKRSRYHNIKARDLEEFKFQLNYFQKKYYIAQPREILASLAADIDIPDDWLLLTFDDGYVDHFRYVFPLLHDQKLSAMFFPPQSVVEQRELLDVNKIHFVLHNDCGPHHIYRKLLNYLNEYGYDDVQIQALTKNYFYPSRFDPPEIMFIKNVLQKGIPLNDRHAIVSKLFKEFVSVDEKAFGEELYLSVEECRLMASMGMFFGSHGKNHYWLNAISDEEQEFEVQESLNFLNRIHSQSTTILSDYVMCYPYGAYNDYTLQLLSKYQFQMALTTQVGDAEVSHETRFKLKRYDTNDFPIG